MRAGPAALSIALCDLEDLIARVKAPGGSEIANTQPFIVRFCQALGLAPPEFSTSQNHFNENYAHFPDRQSYRITMDDLHEARVQARLKAIWTDPNSLDTVRRSPEVTRDIAERLARRPRGGTCPSEANSGFDDVHWPWTQGRDQAAALGLC